MRILFILLSLFLTSVIWSKSIDYTDLVKIDGLYYEKFTDKPFTGKSTGLKQGKIKKGKIKGKWNEYWESGTLKETNIIKKGKKVGEQLIYYENGQLKSKVNFKDDKKEGEQLEYYANSVLHRKTNYRDGKLDGEYLKYYESGELESKGNYKDEKKEGEWLYYSLNGELDITEIYKDGKLIKTIRNWSTAESLKLLREYKNLLKKTVAQYANKNYPKVSIRKKEQGTVHLIFTLKKDGNLKDVEIGSKTTGPKRLINATIKALEEVTPINMVLPGYDFNDKLDIMIVYKLN